MTSSPTNQQSSNSTVKFNGPSTSTYSCILEGGKHFLELYCDGFPGTRSSHILPPVFISEYTEGVDLTTNKIPTRSVITPQEENRMKGIEINLRANEDENAVHKAFTKLFSKTQKHSSLSLQSFEVDKRKLN